MDGSGDFERTRQNTYAEWERTEGETPEERSCVFWSNLSLQGEEDPHYYLTKRKDSDCFFETETNSLNDLELLWSSASEERCGNRGPEDDAIICVKQDLLRQQASYHAELGICQIEHPDILQDVDGSTNCSELAEASMRPLPQPYAVHLIQGQEESHAAWTQPKLQLQVLGKLPDNCFYDLDPALRERFEPTLGEAKMLQVAAQDKTFVRCAIAPEGGQTQFRNGLSVCDALARQLRVGVTIEMMRGTDTPFRAE